MELEEFQEFVAKIKAAMKIGFIDSIDGNFAYLENGDKVYITEAKRPLIIKGNKVTYISDLIVKIEEMNHE